MAASTSIKPKKYIEISSFLGVDFANDETNVDLRRSPWAPNMMSDIAGRPVVRPGYKTLISELGTAKINGIHFHGDTMLLHYGASIAIVSVSAEGEYSIGIPKTGMADALSQSAYMGGKTYILDGANYIAFDGTAFEDVEGYIPTTTIAAAPAGGGTDLEAVNLITGWRRNSFTTDGTAAVFKLDGKPLAADAVSASIAGVEKTEGTHFSVDRTEGIVTFTEGNLPPDDGGIDSVVITFKMLSDGRETIEKCKVIAAYGLGNDTRLFVSGNPEHKNVDYMSGLYDPTYFPDTGYTQIGADDTAIMGYVKQYGSMIIVKEAQGGRGGLFLRSAQSNSDGTTVFPVNEGIQGIGAVNHTAFSSLAGSPVFLTEKGLYGLASNSITNQQSAQLRSWYINPKLLAEELASACVCAWDRFILIAAGGHIYAGTAEATNANKSGSYGYEWYYWTDFPARILKEHEGVLYIGTDDGKLRRLRDPHAEGMAAYADDSAGIDAMWTTPLLDGGNFLREKTISKKGTGILAKPYARSSGEIFFTTDKTIEQATKSYTLDILDFDDIDFNRFTFNTNDDPQPVVSPKKFRRVMTFQMGVRHTAAGEGFGLLAMMITYSVGKLTRKDGPSVGE